MVRTTSTMLPLGSSLPGFVLPQCLPGTGPWSSDSRSAQPLLVMFLCVHCPFVKHVEPEITRLQTDFGERVQLLGISSNSLETHPQDNPAAMAAQRARMGWRFPYLFDGEQTVARAFRAACTPDFFLFDAAGSLVYRGQLDGSRPGNDEPLTGSDLRAALTAALACVPPPGPQRPSIGCNIKWHPGREPAWFG